jgi:hypothetical protein
MSFKMPRSKVPNRLLLLIFSRIAKIITQRKGKSELANATNESTDANTIQLLPLPSGDRANLRASLSRHFQKDISQKSRTQSYLQMSTMGKKITRTGSPIRTIQRNSGGRAKYLPQACERHKMLHARCPATCIDRIRRDAALGITTSAVSTPIASPIQFPDELLQ